MLNTIRIQMCQIQAYIESESFENELDLFAQEIKLSFERDISYQGRMVLRSENRRNRVGLKLSLILKKCGKTTLEASGVGAAVGRALGPQGAAIGTFVGGFSAILYYASIAYGVRSSDYLNQATTV